MVVGPCFPTGSDFASGDICQCLETFFHHSWRRMAWFYWCPAGRGRGCCWTPCSAQEAPRQRTVRPKTSAAPRLRNAVVGCRTFSEVEPESYSCLYLLHTHTRTCSHSLSHTHSFPCARPKQPCYIMVPRVSCLVRADGCSWRSEGLCGRRAGRPARCRALASQNCLSQV